MLKLKEEKLLLRFPCLLLYETTYVFTTRMLICILEKAYIHASSLWHACGCLLNRGRGCHSFWTWEKVTVAAVIFTHCIRVESSKMKTGNRKAVTNRERSLIWKLRCSVSSQMDGLSPSHNFQATNSYSTVAVLQLLQKGWKCCSWTIQPCFPCCLHYRCFCGDNRLFDRTLSPLKLSETWF